ncbi:MAG TPA: glycosyltransferase family 2 protein [Clostridia bacterium]|nr:glycosyltransferase family 2 protein [Clostridia bacterium]
MKKFSFVIPTYNNKILLKNTLEALNNQKGYGLKDYEAVVVDDGSNDDTYEYIKGVNRDYELRYIYLPRTADSCRARTRNTGWKAASGKIIAFIDSDIIVQDNYLSELERCFSMKKKIFVIGNRLMLPKKNNYEDVASGSIYKEYMFDKNDFNLLEFRYFLYEITSYNINGIMCPWMQVYSCNLAIPRRVLKRIGGFDENFKYWGIEDLELGYKLYKKKVQLVINNKLEVLHQYHGERNDLVIAKEKIPGYEINIDYLMKKHPEALRMNRQLAYKFFKGEISSDKLLLEMGYEPVYLEFRDKKELQKLKKKIRKLASRDKLKIIVNDYVEDSDLDIWIQLMGDSTSIVRYYPASRRLDKGAVMQFLKEEKKRQRLRSEA